MSRAVVRAERDSTDERSLVEVRTEVEHRRRGVLEVWDDEHLVIHRLKGRRNDLEASTAIQLDDVLNRTGTGLAVLVKVSMDVVAGEDRAEQIRRGDETIRHRRTLSELLLDERAGVQASDDLVQANREELLDVTRSIRRADRQEARAEVNRAGVSRLIDEVASGIRRSDFSIDLFAEPTIPTEVVDVVERLRDNLDDLAVTADALDLREAGSGVRRTLLTDREVHHEVTAGRKLVGHIAAVDLDADRSLALVVLVVASIDLDTEVLYCEAL